MATRYAFEKRLHDPIHLGEVDFTLRGDGRSHARIGGELQLTPGAAKPAFALAECVYRSRVFIAERGIVRVLNPSFEARGEPHFALFQACEQGSPQAAAHLEKVAVRAGFTSWADLWRWHFEQNHLGTPDDGENMLAREVVGWANVVPIANRRAAA